MGIGFVCLVCYDVCLFGWYFSLVVFDNSVVLFLVLCCYWLFVLIVIVLLVVLVFGECGVLLLITGWCGLNVVCYFLWVSCLLFG